MTGEYLLGYFNLQVYRCLIDEFAYKPDRLTTGRQYRYKPLKALLLQEPF